MQYDYIEQGDSLELMKDIPDGSIDLTVTSPPYDNLRTYNGNIDQWSFEKFQGIARELYRITKDGGVVVWVVGDATIKGSETGTSFRQALYFKECGFNIHDTMIYEKNGCGACGSNKCYIQNFEYMFVLSKGQIKTFNLLYDRENAVVGKQKTNTKRDVYTVDNGRKYREIESKKFGRRFNIWKYNQTSGHDAYSNKHPAPFPETLVSDHILSWSNPGDVVFDPFLGSGTTAKMAVLNDRHYIGFELDPTYFDIACQRLDKVEGKIADGC